MSGFSRNDQGVATLGGVCLDGLAEAAGVTTPAYVYDLDGIQAVVRRLLGAFSQHPGLIAYAVKANSAGSVLRSIQSAGGGADVVSGAELEVALGSGIEPGSIVMSGVAKADWEIDLAIQKEILGIQAESVEELARIANRARTQGKRARVAVRINPSVDIDSHSHIRTGHEKAKFGIPAAELANAFAAIDDIPEQLDCVGISTHVGSMLSAVEPYLASAEVVCNVAIERRAKGKPVTYVDFGGGWGIDYAEAGGALPPEEFIRAAVELLRKTDLSETRLVVEPGRAVVGPYGALLARVIQTKETQKQRWLMLDAGMNDLLRPALYGARHRIEPLERGPGRKTWQVVGPVCESSDDFGAHELGEAPECVVIRDVGAYAFSMASEYNGRALPSEVFLSQGKIVACSPSPGPESWVKRRLEA